MRLILTVLLLFITVAGIYGAGSALPQERTLIRGAQYKIPREVIWPVIADIKATGIWDPDIAEVRPIPDPQNELGNLWHVEYENGHYAILRSHNNAREYLQKRRIVESSGLPSGRWEISAVENRQGTFVRLVAVYKTESPWMRFLRHYILNTDAEMRHYLQGLAEHYDVNIKIQELAV